MTGALCTPQIHGIPFLLYHYVHILLSGAVTTLRDTFRRWLVHGRIEALSMCQIKDVVAYPIQ